MNVSVSPFVIDVVVIGFVLIMMMIGYIKGCIVRIYDVLTSFAALFLAMFLSGPLSRMYSIYPIDGMEALIGNFINQLVIFGIVFMVLKIIFWIIGKFVRPMLKSTIARFGLIKKFDRILGIIVSLIESLLFVYLALIMMISPVFSNGQDIIEETTVAKYVLHLVPSMTEKVEGINKQFNAISVMLGGGLNSDPYDGLSMYSMAMIMNQLHNIDVLDEEYGKELVERYFSSMDDKSIVTSKQYQEIKTMLDRLEPEMAEKIYEKIIVSDENE